MGSPVSAPELHAALRRTGGAVRQAAALLGRWPSVVSMAARRFGLRTNPGGARPRHDVCWLEAPDGLLPAAEFSALWGDVGVCQLAALLGLSPASVSQRALRLGLRGRRPSPRSGVRE